MKDQEKEIRREDCEISKIYHVSQEDSEDSDDLYWLTKCVGGDLHHYHSICFSKKKVSFYVATHVRFRSDIIVYEATDDEIKLYNLISNLYEKTSKMARRT